MMERLMSIVKKRRHGNSEKLFIWRAGSVCSHGGN